MSIGIMHHYINKKVFFNIFRKNSVIKETVGYCFSEKPVNKGSFILHQQQVVYNHHQNFSLRRTRNQMSVGNEILLRCLLLWEAYVGKSIGTYTAQKMKFSLRISSVYMTCSFLRIRSHLLKKSLMESLIFGAMLDRALFILEAKIWWWSLRFCNGYSMILLDSYSQCECQKENTVDCLREHVMW